MTVLELIKALSQYPGDMDVFVNATDDDYLVRDLDVRDNYVMIEF